MAKNNNRITELLKENSELKQQIAKLEQLITNIKGLIDLQGFKPIGRLDFLNGTIDDKPFLKGTNTKSERREWTIEEQVEHLLTRLKSEGIKLILPDKNKEYKAVLTRNTEGATEQEKRPVATSKEEQPRGGKKVLGRCEALNCKKWVNQGDEYAEGGKVWHYDCYIEDEPTPKKTTRRTNLLKEVKEQAKQEGGSVKTAATSNISVDEVARIAAEAYGNKKIRINPKSKEEEEAEELEGAKGNKEYERLLAKEKKGGATAGTCPVCGEVLEEPITRGHHTECFNAKLKKEAMQ